ncbi:hypothetical protein B0T26DRAFT_203295 [Lasiosphaeria miniovina]|uniref:Uncharacterized protein n=1 Tax=Lasiosphaeria miniovina TaxID=1954250 RepID=A0AA40AUC4_9PEZI|nr:uncharacterized protein B0T26DRAFT_203295 [Lasiosphaeria miniovina]KAK0722123.1 hypothetical protein B0T26DRAFT_203295 [Lasiosphaeria miniovina]
MSDKDREKQYKYRQEIQQVPKSYSRIGLYTTWAALMALVPKRRLVYRESILDALPVMDPTDTAICQVEYQFNSRSLWGYMPGFRFLLS